MPLVKWMACFEANALAAAATDQWGFAASYAHKATCLQIARDRTALDRPALVAVCDDEVVRKRLADRTQKNAPDSNPNKNTHLVDECLLKQAIKLYAERGGAVSQGGKASYGGKGKDKGKGGGSSWNNNNWSSSGWSGKGNWTKPETSHGEKRTLPWESDHYAKKPKGGKGGDAPKGNSSFSHMLNLYIFENVEIGKNLINSCTNRSTCAPGRRAIVRPLRKNNVAKV
jgi:hypothetical protein